MSKKHHWHFVVSCHDLENGFLDAGQVKTVSVSNKDICLGRIANEYYAVSDYCPHAGGSLGEGWCDTKGNVICPYHRIGFRLKDGGPATGKGYYVDSYPVELREDGLYIGFKKKWWEF